MKFLLLLSLVTFACSARLHMNRPFYWIEMSHTRTLADDLREIRALIPENQLEDLFRKYLLGDAEFQGIIRYIGSPDVLRAAELIASQPELKALNSWLQQQLPYGKLGFLSDESESNELKQWLNYYLLQRDQPLGWKGFMEEFLGIYPRQEIRNLIRDKVAANGIFAEYWGKLIALRPMYERIMKLPEIRKVIERFGQLGVDVAQLDQLIREDFGWKLAGNQQLAGNNNGKQPLNKPLGNSNQIIPKA